MQKKLKKICKKIEKISGWLVGWGVFGWKNNLFGWMNEARGENTHRQQAQQHE
jgi:hypothetical protein